MEANEYKTLFEIISKLALKLDGDCHVEIMDDFSDLKSVPEEELVIKEIIGNMSNKNLGINEEEIVDRIIRLRVAIMNIENAYSNCADSLERLLIKFRDKE